MSTGKHYGNVIVRTDFDIAFQEIEVGEQGTHMGVQMSGPETHCERPLNLCPDFSLNLIRGSVFNNLINGPPKTSLLIHQARNSRLAQQLTRSEARRVGI